jgi:hypothetical protein
LSDLSDVPADVVLSKPESQDFENEESQVELVDTVQKTEHGKIIIIDDDGPEVEVVQFEKPQKPKTVLEVVKKSGTLPLSCEDFLEKYEDKMYEYEKKELLSGQFTTIYYAADIVDRERLT